MSGIVRKILENRTEIIDQKSGLVNPKPWFTNWLGAGGQNDSGEVVTPNTSMQVAAVFSAVSIISESVAMVPFEVVREKNNKNELQKNHPLMTVFNVAFNGETTAIEGRDWIQGHALLRGNCFAQKIYNGLGERVGLVSLHPDKMRIAREAGELRYFYSTDQGEKEIPARDVWHFKGRSDDGVMGISPIETCARSIGLAIATERHGARLFGQAARPDGALIHKKNLSKQAQENLKEQWKQKYAGGSNSHGLAIFEEDMQWVQIGMKSNEAQFLETRNFGIGDIARIFKIPRGMLGAGDDKNAGTTEQRFREFVLMCLLPWLRRWEQSITLHLLTEKERKQGYHVRFLLNELLQGDKMAQAQFFAMGRQWGWFNSDEVRDELGYDPIPDDGGKEFLRPMNMQIVGEEPVDADPNAPQPEPIKNLADPNPKRGITMKLEPITRNNPAIDLAFVEVFQDTLGRILRKEAINLEKNSRKIAKVGEIRDFEIWVSEFYDDQMKHIAEVSTPSIRAVMIAKGLIGNAEELADQFAFKRACIARGEVLSIARSGKEPAEILQSLDEIAGRWRSDTAKEWATDAVKWVVKAVNG